MAISWSRVADFTQRSLAVMLFGLTLYGTSVLARGGYGVVQRRKQRKALEAGEGKPKTGEGEPVVQAQVTLEGGPTTVPVECLVCS